MTFSKDLSSSFCCFEGKILLREVKLILFSLSKIFSISDRLYSEIDLLKIIFCLFLSFENNSC